MIDETFAIKVRQERILQNLSQSELAKRAGISRTYLSQIERGESINLSWQVRKSLADELGIPVEQSSTNTEGLNNLPEGLEQFASEKHLPEADIAMLARLEYRGRKPTTPEQWKILYGLIKSVIGEE